MTENDDWQEELTAPGMKRRSVGFDLSQTERLSYSTTRLECWDAEGNEFNGTGFFFDFAVREGSVVPVVVTNKHVVEGAHSGKLKMHGADANWKLSAAEGIWLEIDNFETAWIAHPDPEIDLCVLPFAPFIKAAAKAKLRPLVARLNASAMASDADVAGLDMVEDVLMVGYPNGIWDHYNDLPIMRRGTTATHVAKDFQGRKEFLIDLSTIPGSSGSPVFLYRRTGNMLENGNGKLLGIVYKVFHQNAAGEILEAPAPTGSNASVWTPFPINLGIVIRATQLLGFTEELERRSRPD